jgi:DNA-binding NarL/FixJ family response regulator
MADPVTVLLVDDHTLFRESVARMLGAEAGFVVSDCGSVSQALASLRERKIDVVLLDFDLGTNDGIDFMREAKQLGFAGRVLVVTAGVEDHEAASLVESGVAGIFLKHNSAALLAQGIRDVAAGKAWFDSDLLQVAIRGRAGPHPAPLASLTQRERDVLSYVFEGLANKEISARLGVSESSVKATLQQLFSKTGVRTRSQLVRVALEQHRGLL